MAGSINAETGVRHPIVGRIIVGPMVTRNLQICLTISMLGWTEPAWSVPEQTKGPELVQALLAPESRLEAFRELYRRTEPKEKDNSPLKYFNTEVVVCPQPAGPPIYVILCDEVELSSPDDANSFGSKNLDRLFPVKPPPAFSTAPPNERKRGKVIFAYTSDGTRCTPFGGDNVLEGYLMDINQDGLVECIQATNYGYPGKSTKGCLQILEVRQVAGERAKTVFRALINDAKDDWGWELLPENGSFVVELGPKQELLDAERLSFLAGENYRLASVAAEFRWNKITQRYEGPPGSPTEHFLVLDSAKNIWKELAEVEKLPRFAVLSTPAPTPSLTDFSEEGSHAAVPTSPPAQTSPWVYHSLAGKSDDELLRIMTKGKSASDVAFEEEMTHVPEGFWELPPKRAAMDLVQANRSATANEKLPLAMDDLDGSAPPKEGETGLEWRSGGCGPETRVGLTILKYRPEKSDLAVSSVVLNPVGAGKAELRSAIQKTRAIPISTEVARQAYEIVWWLSRIRMTPDANSGLHGIVSTGDGEGTFWFLPGQPRLAFTIVGSPGRRFEEKYDRETWANFASIVLNQLEKKLQVDLENPTATVGKPWALSAKQKLVWKTKPPDPSHIAETKTWVTGMLAIMRSNKEGLTDYAIDALAPIKDSSRYQDPRIDQALGELVTTAMSHPNAPKDPGDSKVASAAWAGRALARRGNRAVFPKLMQLLRRPSASFSIGKEVALEGAELCALRDPEARTQLRNYLEEQLTNIHKSDLRVPELFEAVWVLQFVEFKPLLKKLATESENEIESERASTMGPHVGGGDRYHAARRISTAWEEEDALTRLKLATILEATSYREIDVPDLLRSQVEAFTPEQRASFGNFVRWLGQQTNPPMNNLETKKLRGAFGPSFNP